MALTLPVPIADYRDRVCGSHDYRIDVHVLTMEQKLLATGQLLDGQINIQRDSTVRRTATLTLLDPSQALGLDTDDPTEGALFANRMIRIQHRVTVGGVEVPTTCFVGPIAKVTRNGPTLDVEAQDKSALAILGSKPYRVSKGTNAVTAMVAIMRDCTGERHFRISRSRFRLPAPLTVSWAEESSPWSIVQRIARQAGLRAYYSADGYFTVAPRPSSPSWTFNGSNMTSLLVGDHDFSGVINYARVTSSDEKRTVVRAAAPAPSHPLSAQSLARNGAPRWMPTLAEVSGVGAKPKRPKVKKGRKLTGKQRRAYAQKMDEWRADVKSTAEKAMRSARSLLAAGLAMEADLSLDAVPVFHLDAGDLIRVTTDAGSRTLPLDEASIPLVSGDMSVGTFRRVSRPPRSRK